METKDTVLQLAIAADCARRARKTGRMETTKFFGPELAAHCASIAKAEGVFCRAEGGYDDAERARMVFSEDDAANTDALVAALRITWDARHAQIGHRDLLGALMRLGMERDCFGDIVRTADGEAYIFCLPEFSSCVAENFIRAGGASLTTEVSAVPEMLSREEGEEISVSVTSMRLDAVLAAGFHLARGEASERIAAGLAARNHTVTLKADALVAEGDVLSLRGEGRLRVGATTGVSRKGRKRLILFRYGKEHTKWH